MTLIAWKQREALGLLIIVLMTATIVGCTSGLLVSVADPTKVTADAGQTATFSTTATNVPAPYSYQWQRSTNAGTSYSDITGANSASYTTTTLNTTDNGNYYRVIVSDSTPNVSFKSGAALLTVNAALSTSTPSDASIIDGQTANFSTTASNGTSPYAYQWQLSTNSGTSYTNISGATSASYTTPVLNSINTGNVYRVIVTDSATVPTSVTSSAATVTVGIALSTSSPSNLTVDSGQTAAFSTTASNGTSPYTYQWQVSTGGAYSNVSTGTGGTTASYTTAVLNTGNNGNTYRVVVTDSAVTSVTSGVATLTVNSALSTSTPSNTTVDAGQTATFSTTASNGTSPYTYQWQVSTGGAYTNVSTGTGGTTTTYTTASLTTGSSGNTYRVVVTDSAAVPNSVTSGSATLTVNSALSTSAPSNTTVDAGQTATFSTTASNGTSPYAYQWQVSTGGAYSNVSSGTGATTANYTTASLTTGSSGNTYRVVVTDSAAVPTSVTSGSATLTVNPAISTTTPSNQTISLSVSNTATFSTVTSNGTSPYSYQWQVNSQGISSFVNVSTGTGGTTASYTTGTLTISGNNGDLYRVVVTDSATVPSSVTSGNATLTVTAWMSEPEKIISLSCPSASFCMAIDAQGNAWSYHESRWKLFTGFHADQLLNNVSCSNDSFCTAISTKGHAFLYNGSWNSGVPFDPHEGKSNFISCPTDSFCMVVNNNEDSFVYDGKAWTYAKGIYSDLVALSCAGAKDCVATDAKGNSSHYDGAQWHPNEQNPISEYVLSALSCTGKKDLFCMAVDRGGNAFVYEGMSWIPRENAGPITRTAFNAISCVDKNFCLAVDNKRGLFHYDGLAWNFAKALNRGHSIHSLNCPTRSVCLGIDDKGKLWEEPFNFSKTYSKSTRVANGSGE